MFKDQTRKFIYRIPSKPFYIVVVPEWWHEYPYNSLWDLRGALRSTFMEE